MNVRNRNLSGAHRTMLLHEALHAGVVLIVVLCATIVTLTNPSVIPSDLLSFVFGGAMQYAGARAASVRQSLVRTGDADAGG